MTIRLLLSIAAVVCGILLVLGVGDVDPWVIAGVGIICAALAAVVTA